MKIKEFHHVKSKKHGSNHFNLNRRCGNVPCRIDEEHERRKKFNPQVTMRNLFLLAFCITLAGCLGDDQTTYLHNCECEVTKKNVKRQHQDDHPHPNGNAWGFWNNHSHDDEGYCDVEEGTVVEYYECTDDQRLSAVMLYVDGLNSKGKESTLKLICD